MQRELALLYKYTEAWNGCMFNWKDYMILNIDEMKTTCPWAIVKDTKKWNHIFISDNHSLNNFKIEILTEWINQYKIVNNMLKKHMCPMNKLDGGATT